MQAEYKPKTDAELRQEIDAEIAAEHAAPALPPPKVKTMTVLINPRLPWWSVARIVLQVFVWVGVLSMLLGMISAACYGLVMFAAGSTEKSGSVALLPLLVGALAIPALILLREMAKGVPPGK